MPLPNWGPTPSTCWMGLSRHNTSLGEKGWFAAEGADE